MLVIRSKLGIQIFAINIFCIFINCILLTYNINNPFPDLQKFELYRSRRYQLFSIMTIIDCLSIVDEKPNTNNVEYNKKVAN